MISEELLTKLKMVAPGTKLRKALDDIVIAGLGALILFVDEVEKNTIQDGFRLDTSFSPEKLFELAKMDGAIIVSEDLSKIVAANAHLVPDTSIMTTATGARHRAGERVAQQTGKMVIVVSERRQVVTVYYKKQKHQINNLNFLTTKVNQALNTLEKYRHTFDKKIARLNAEESTGKANLRDIVDLINKGIDVVKIKEAIIPFAIELGSEGQLADMQLKEITDDIDELLEIVIMDYSREHISEEDSTHAISEIKGLKERGPLVISRILGYDIANIGQWEEISVKTRGYRILKHGARIPMAIAHKVVKNFHYILQITPENMQQLLTVEGVGEKRAHAILDSIKSWDGDS